MRVAGFVFCLALCLSAPAVLAKAVPMSFEDEAKQQRYEEFLEEVRCLVCQNQSLADSPADLAQDLRREIHTMIDQGKSDEEITDFLLARYGDFILYRPRLQRSTWLLWFGPFILLLVAVAIVIRFIRSRSRPDESEEDTELSRAQRERAARLLEDGDDR